MLNHYRFHSDARRLFNSGIAGLSPEIRSVDIVFSGSPCQRASWAPHFNLGTEPDADDPMNALYPDQVHTIVQHSDAALIEFLKDVTKLRSPEGSPNAARPPGWRHDGMLGNFERVPSFWRQCTVTAHITAIASANRSTDAHSKCGRRDQSVFVFGAIGMPRNVSKSVLGVCCIPDEPC